MIKKFHKYLRRKYPNSNKLIDEIIKEFENYLREEAKKSYIKNKEKVKKRTAKNTDIKRFGGQRQLILERDNYQCQECGMTNEQHILIFNRSLIIHHLDGKGINSKNPNNTQDNLQTLCLRCHGRKDHRDLKIQLTEVKKCLQK